MESLVSWAVAHSSILAGVGVALLDLIIAINPKADSNGVLHWVYLQLQKMAGKKPEA